MSQQIIDDASTIPLQQHRRGNRLVEFALIFTIGFAATSLLKLESLARNSVQNQNHNGQFDLPQPQSNHSVDMQQFQSGMPLLSSNNTSATVESLERDHQDDADNSESDSESCLRPRRNSDAAVKSPLKLPCKISMISFVLYLMDCLFCAASCISISKQKTHSHVIMHSSRFYPSHAYTSYQSRHAQNGLDISPHILPMRRIRIHPLDVREKPYYEIGRAHV